jgi:hypothetical protein
MMSSYDQDEVHSAYQIRVMDLMGSPLSVDYKLSQFAQSPSEDETSDKKADEEL